MLRYRGEPEYVGRERARFVSVVSDISIQKGKDKRKENHENEIEKDHYRAISDAWHIGTSMLICPMGGRIMQHRVWHSMEEVFSCLGKNDIYVILTGEELLEGGFEGFGLHHDIDILVVNQKRTKELIEGRAYFDDEHFVINLNGTEAVFGIFELGDDYIDSLWQKDMLEKRVLHSGGYYVMDKEDHLYWMMYHGLCHKKSVPEHYREGIEKASCAMGIEVESQEHMWKLLEKFLIERGYGCPYPKKYFKQIYTQGFEEISPTGYREWQRKRLMRLPMRAIKRILKNHIRSKG